MAKKKLQRAGSLSSPISSSICSIALKFVVFLFVVAVLVVCYFYFVILPARVEQAQEGLTQYEKDLDPDGTPPQEYEDAQTARNKGDNEAAIKHMQGFVRKYPNHCGGLMQLAELHHLVSEIQSHMAG